MNLTFRSKWVKAFKNWISLQRTRVSHFSVIFFIVNSTVIPALNESRSAFIGKKSFRVQPKQPKAPRDLKVSVSFYGPVPLVEHSAQNESDILKSG